MNNVEHYFDINMVLMTIYASLKTVREEEEVELVYDIERTVPKEFRGDVESITYVLTQLATFVMQNTSNWEVLCHLLASEDFLYEGTVTFEVDDTGISREKAVSFFEIRLKPVLKRLNAKATYNDATAKISVSIPLKLFDLGNRRYYRLPDIRMLGKKVLLITKSRIVSESLQKMFNYFLYKVDVGADDYKERGSNLAIYDIFVLEDNLLTPGIERLVQKVQEQHDLKFIILQDADKARLLSKACISAYLVKPIMQESIFELIIALYQKEVGERKFKRQAGKPIINMEKYIMNAFEKSEEIYTQRKKSKEKNVIPQKKETPTQKIDLSDKDLMVLNTKNAIPLAKEAGMNYKKMLRDFVERFDKSDIYFRDIATSKSVWQIKEFAIDLEQHAKVIGAERVGILAEKISLLFVYNNLDMLPIYTGKYHLELKRLMDEIARYFKEHP